MAQNRSSQRGVIKTATAAIIAALGALASMTGCSSDQGSGGSERLGVSVQALTCNKLSPCPPSNECAKITCNLSTFTCDITPLAKDGEKCPTSGKGVCTSFPAAADGTPVPVCCTGCTQLVKGGYACHPGDETKFCGEPAKPGSACFSCDTQNVCSQDSCKSGQCVSDTQALDKTACNGVGQCWGGVCCSGCIDKNDQCQQGNATTACGKSSVNGLVGCNDCTDGEPICTSDSCDAKGSCVNSAVSDNTPCADNTKCNGDEVCKSGVCKGPANFSCDDSNVCTAESCDAVTGCAHQKLTGTSCADANKCNGDEVCNNGACGVGTPLDCNDNNACTTDTCAPATGCVNTKKVDGVKCEDATKCNGIETCSNGVCIAGTPPNCDDGNPCTADSCDAAQGCMHTAVGAGTKCDDGNVCNGISTCVGTVCTAGTPLSCDDGNVCTDDSCVPATGCKFVNNTADCSDNNLCTVTDKCDGNGSCKGSGAPNCDDHEACTTDSCDPARGCQHNAVVDGGNCDDGNDCSTGDKCVAGKCKASGGKLCDDSDPCTQNTCDPQNGSVCAYPAETNGTPCTFDKCHQNSTCQAGKCDQGDPIDCDDANPCTTDSCDALTGCKHVADNAATCSDGDLCTKADHCKSGVCIGTDITCTPLDECHEPGKCSTDTGVCDDPRSEDGKVCTGGHCQLGKCVLDPIGAGGAGGEAGLGAGGDGTALPEGGAPTSVGTGGEGNEAVTSGGESTNANGGNAGKGGSKATGGSSITGEGGAPEIPDHVFVRDPGGCSCTVPASPSGQGWAGLAALAVGVGLVARGRRRRQAGQRHVSL
ncbi:MAG TPA: MYXO-CTERM sorting domain-containing protein [Polyangiaceae bacterium]|nr:MYXO-CTERM sorting domain-containing protein [Polyangiaceae bacterium]